MAGKIVNVTDATFKSEVRDASVPVLVDFWAPWCGPCVAISPILEELAAEFDGRCKIAKVNVDENPIVPSEFSVRSIPHLVLMKDGKAVQAVTGAMPKARFKSLIESAL